MLESAPQSRKSLSDEQLTLRCAETNPVDEDAWRVFYNRFYEKIWLLVRLRGVREADAGDVIQNIFVKVFCSLPHYDPHRASPATFLNQIVKSVAFDFFRADARRPPMTHGGDNEAPEPQGEVGMWELLQVTDFMIDQQAENTLDAAIMRELRRGKTVKEVALERAISEGRVYAVRSKLRALLPKVSEDPRIKGQKKI